MRLSRAVANTADKVKPPDLSVRGQEENDSLPVRANKPSISLYHIVRHMRSPKLPSSIRTRWSKVQPLSVNILALCFLASSVLIHGIKTDAPITILAQFTCMRTPSGCRSYVFHTVIFRFRIKLHHDYVSRGEHKVGTFSQSYLLTLTRAFLHDFAN